MLTQITGSPVGKFGQKLIDQRNSTGGQTLSLLRDYMFIRLMNNMGIAQLPELGNTLGIMGVKTLITAMPSFRGFLRNARTGRLNDEVMAEIEASAAIGLDPLRHVSFNRWDDFGTYVDPSENELLNKTRDALEGGKRMTGYISAMVPINAGMQRLTAKMMAQKLAHMAHGIAKMDTNRLNSLGLSKVELDGIFKELREKSEMVNGFRDKKLTKLNLENWEPQARADFEMALYRTTRKLIQENDAGNLHRWMTNPMAQMLLQFRTFVAVGFWKQFAAGLHQRRDPAQWAAWMMSTFLGGLTYVGQTYTNGINRADHDEYLSENLTPERIAAGAWQRSSWSSILPMAADTAWLVGNDEPLFDTRSSGLSNNLLGNPTVDFVQNAYRALRGGVRAATDSEYDFSQSDWRNATSLLPFFNAQGIKQTNNFVMQGLPETSR